MSFAQRNVTTAPPHAAPRPVRHAFGLCAAAVGCDLAVAAYGAGSGSGESALSTGVFAAALVLAVRLRGGDPWARTALALLLAVFGTLSVATAAVHGHALAAVGPGHALGIGVLALHAGLVAAGVACAHRAEANAWFRTVRR
ncbi:hypothetical protein [Streptomyces sp. NPDC050560]|uniref:hypothetical protein n=1 Tax=Streptomyces sp. NPDC050560 TaxID=3365630 RepID=UPI0037A86102